MTLELHLDKNILTLMMGSKVLNMDIKKDLTRAALAGAVVAGGMLGGSAAVKGSENSENLVPGPKGSVVVTMDDGSRIMCPDPSLVNQTGDVVGMLVPPSDSEETVIPFLCKPGKHDTMSLLPGHTVREVDIVLSDGSKIQAVTTDGTLDFQNPMVPANATPIPPVK